MPARLGSGLPCRAEQRNYNHVTLIRPRSSLASFPGFPTFFRLRAVRDERLVKSGGETNESWRKGKPVYFNYNAFGAMFHVFSYQRVGRLSM